jgi:hypothetical protein
MAAATSSAGTLRIGVIVLAVATAAIHLYLGLTVGLALFVLNGLGYLALVSALYAPIPQLASYNNLVRWALIGYTALTIVLWLAIGERNLIGYADKLIEVALIALLLIERRQKS